MPIFTGSTSCVRCPSAPLAGRRVLQGLRRSGVSGPELASREARAAHDGPRDVADPVLGPPEAEGETELQQVRSGLLGEPAFARGMLQQRFARVFRLADHRVARDEGEDPRSDEPAEAHAVGGVVADRRAM